MTARHGSSAAAIRYLLFSGEPCRDASFTGNQLGNYPIRIGEGDR